MKKIPIIFIFSLCFIALNAQYYNTAIGTRFGNSFGVTLNQRFLDKASAEVILQHDFNTKDYTLHLLAKRHIPVISKRFNLFIGGGIGRTWQNNFESTNNNDLGLSFIGGAELTLGRVNVGWDFHPTFNVGTASKHFEMETAISVRYVLWKRQDEKNKKFKIFGDRDKKNKKKKRKKPLLKL